MTTTRRRRRWRDDKWAYLAFAWGAAALFALLWGITHH